MDDTSRKFVSVAKKFTDATFVIENKEGAGGLVGMAGGPRTARGRLHRLRGHDVEHREGSHVEENVDEYVWGFEWIAMAHEGTPRPDRPRRRP
jgi:hypothetical protein